MKILVTGAGGYIGMRLIPSLIEAGHEICAAVRDKDRFYLPEPFKEKVQVIELDFLKPETLDVIPEDIEVAFFLMHSMANHKVDYAELEHQLAGNFIARMKQISIKQIIFLSGLSNELKLTKHMASRRHVEDLLVSSNLPYTILRASIILGAGSISFEIIRDLVEKLPIMVAPIWVGKKCQPIAVFDVIYYLVNSVGKEQMFSHIYEIGGTEVLSYKELLHRYAKVRKLKRWILLLPLLTPRLSSYWLVFITSSNYYIARSLVDSMRVNSTMQNHDIDQIIPHETLSIEEALQRALSKIEQNAVISSWKTAFSFSDLHTKLAEYVEVPQDAVCKDVREYPLKATREAVIASVFSIGGNHGWYALNWAWEIRGLIDRCFGGHGLNRGRTNPGDLRPGDTVDFWRVIRADKEQGILLLYAEMKVPGEAWLSFEISETTIKQTATFRPKGVGGRLYWYSLWLVHQYIFSQMCKKLSMAK
ncbi:MAG: SDR family oxidoreductase [Simkaniaceae bacterium]|nr:SDR family oxidoreductase [Simkaniaceae bacterium]